MYTSLLFTSLIFLLMVEHGNCQCSSALELSTSLYTIYTLESPNYPSYYYNYASCTWNITASSTSSRLLFHIPYVSIERSYDFFNIYDGTVSYAPEIYGSRYANEPTIAVTTGRNAYVRFTSDYSITYGGFQANYVEVDSTSRYCSRSLTATSTKQHAWYTYGSYCYLTISASSGNVVRLSVLNLAISVQLIFGDTDGSSAQSITSASISEYVSLTSTAYVQLPTPFTSFMFTYEEVSSGTNNIVTVATVDYGINICSVTSLIATSTPAHITTPDYPSPYPLSVSCAVTITASDSSKSLMIVIDDYDVNYDDYLYIYDGDSSAYSLLGSYWYTGQAINSTAQSFHLEFYSGYSGVLRGFRLNYTEITRGIPNCASSYNTYQAGTSVQVISKGPYSNYEEEYWLIVKSSLNENLVLDLSSISIEEATSCQYDSITFYDGPCDTDPILATVCGYVPVTFEDSTGLYVLVKFVTDGSVVKDGFNLNYYIGGYTSDDAVSPDADDEDEDDDDTLYYIIAIVAIFAFAFFIAMIAVVVYYKRVKRKRMAIASGVIPAPKPKLTPKTPQQLLSEISKKLNKDKQNETKPKLQRKASRMDNYHPQPAPPGPGVSIITRPDMPIHPAPSAPPAPPIQPGPSGKPVPLLNTGGDPAYPPSYDVGNEQMKQPMNPAFPPGYDPSSYFKPLVIPEGTIPSQFTYLSPSDARSMGLHR